MPQRQPTRWSRYARGYVLPPSKERPNRASRAGIRGAQATSRKPAGSRGGHLFGNQREESVFETGRALARLLAQIVQRSLRDQPPTRDHANAISHSFGHF